MFDYTNQVVAITGASSGLGKQMAHGFAEQGATLFLMDINERGLTETVSEFKQEEINCIGHTLDVTDAAAIEKAAQRVKNEFGKVDVLVNCAGKAKDVGVLEMSTEDWRSTIECDLSSIFYMTRSFGQIIKNRGYGRIINISSIYGLVGNMLTGTIAYHSGGPSRLRLTEPRGRQVAK